MKRLLVTGFLLAVALSSVAAQGRDTLGRRNLGLILGTPFLHQEELPYESEHYGTYGNELVSFEFDERGLPLVIRYADLTDGTPYLDAEVTYGTDSRIRSLTYYSYDDTGLEVIYVDRFEFTRVTEFGPTLGIMTTEEGVVAEMRLRYDESGRLVGLTEDDALGEGLFRSERYAWAGDPPGSRPYAVELRFPIDGEIERYRYLYDARGYLQGIDGVNFLESDPNDRTPVHGWYLYRSGSLDEIFGRVVPPTTVAARRPGYHARAYWSGVAISPPSDFAARYGQ